MVSPGRDLALVLALEADDQLVVQFAPLNWAANGPLRKVCICEAEMFAARRVGRQEAECRLKRLVDRGLGRRGVEEK